MHLNIHCYVVVVVVVVAVMYNSFTVVVLAYIYVIFLRYGNKNLAEKILHTFCKRDTSDNLSVCF